MARFFGTPEGVQVGDLFIDRMDLNRAEVHRPIQAGISGTEREGADSICLSGGYSDDQDHGDYVIYTGHGGRDPNTGKQIADQSVHATGNAGLITSRVQGLPVRLVRGARHVSPYSPPSGFQYAGLFTVTEWWVEAGNDGFDIVRFRLDRVAEQKALWTGTDSDLDASFKTSIVSRRIRDSALSRHVKTLYNYGCQLCDIAIPGIGGRLYSEGAHVRPVGNPHLGPDSLENILSLCPNHHVQLDIGGMVILENFEVAISENHAAFGALRFSKGHRLSPEFAFFHRQLWR